MKGTISSEVQNLAARLVELQSSAVALEKKVEEKAASCNHRIDGVKDAVEAKVASCEAKIDGLKADMDRVLGLLQGITSPQPIPKDAESTGAQTRKEQCKETDKEEGEKEGGKEGEKEEEKGGGERTPRGPSSKSRFLRK